MRDLYRVSHFPVIEDIYGEECFVKETRLDETFGIELHFGRPVTSTMGASRIIVTEALKTFILNSMDVPMKEFSGVLKSHMVSKLRRKLRENPYDNYRAWRESTDSYKPREIYLPLSKEKREYIKDHFGVVYVLYTAMMTDGGDVFLMGVPKDIYHAPVKKTKRFILTSELVAMIKAYHLYPHKGIEQFPFNMQTFIALKNELGYHAYQKEDVNRWLAAHLPHIMEMTAQVFYEDYAASEQISTNTIATVKTSCHHLMQYKKEKTPKNKEILKLMRRQAKRVNLDEKKQLIALMGKSRYRDDFRAFRLLLLAKQYKHPLPKNLKWI